MIKAMAEVKFLCINNPATFVTHVFFATDMAVAAAL
jgi:hypothetical protein